MGLTNYLKNKLEKHPNTTKALNATKQGATKTYKYAKKAINSPQLDRIGQAATGIGKGIDKGAGLFNNSLGFGEETTNNLKIWPNRDDFDFSSQSPKQKHKNKHRYQKQHTNNKQILIIRHEYGSRHQRQEHRHSHQNKQRHREKEWQIGDL